MLALNSIDCRQRVSCITAIEPLCASWVQISGGQRVLMVLEQR